MATITISELADAVHALKALGDGERALVHRALAEMSPAGAAAIVSGDGSSLDYPDKTIYENVLQSDAQRLALERLLALPADALTVLAELLRGDRRVVDECRVVIEQAARHASA
jgi:hypothetical protein